MFSMHLYYGLCLLLALGVSSAKFKVPEVLIEAISPKGFRVSIPHVDGISLFAFHGNLNKDIEELEGGQFSVDINEEENGRWTYSNRVKKLKIGDVINYWVYVDYFDGERKLGYMREGESFTVTQFIGATVSTTTTSKPVTTSGGCESTATQVNGQPSCKGRLIFEENFEKSINPKWTPEVKFASEPDNNFVIYHNRENNLRILNNQLHIKPSLTENTFDTVGKEEYNLGNSCTGKIGNTIDCHRQIFSYLIIPPVTSAQITTKNNFSFRYGTIEIRAKLPEGDWIYPELFLKNKNDDYGPGLESGLIRIAFTPGNLDLSKSLYGGCVLGTSTAARRRELKKMVSENHWTSEYHTYQLIWKPDQITLKVDNITYGNIYPPEGGFASYANSVDIDGKISERWKQGTPLAPFDKEDNNFVIYHNRENNLRILNNQLHIKPSLTENTFDTVGKEEYNLGNSCTGKIGNTIDCHRQIFSYLIIPPVTSAQITTKNNFSFRYGTIEIRAKLPEGDWIYPELFLKNKNDDYGPGLESGLIRIAFTPGNLDLSKSLYGGCVLGTSTAARRRELKKMVSENHWTSEYHTYQLIWKPDQITLKVDNITYGNIYPPEGGFASYANSVDIDGKISERWKQGTPLAPFDKEMYIVVGVGVGGRVFLEQGDTCIFWDYDSPKAEYQFNKAKSTWSSTWNDRSTLTVDYVKVWAL